MEGQVEFSEVEGRLLREADEWRPSAILSSFPRAERESEYLPRMLVASAVFLGARGCHLMVERLMGLLTVRLPRVQQMAADDGLSAERDVIKVLAGRLGGARTLLLQIRSRANNDIASPDRSHHDGLRYFDLQLLAQQVEDLIMASEIGGRRNSAGVRAAIAYVSRVPDEEYAEGWLEALLGSTSPGGILFYTPPEWGRVVVVHRDGRLAFDPAPAESA